MKDFFSILRKYLKPYLGYAGLNIIFNTLGILFGLFSLIIIGPFLEILFGTQPAPDELLPFAFSKEVLINNFYYYMEHFMAQFGAKSNLVFVCLLVLITFFLKNLFIYLGNFYMAPIRNGVIRDIRNKIYRKITRLHLGYFSDEKKGDIISRITGDVQEIEWTIMQSLQMIFREPINIILSLITLLILSPQLTLFALIIMPVSGYLIGVIGRSLRKNSLKGQEKMGSLLSIIEETLTGLRIIKAFNAEENVSNRFGKENQEYNKIANMVTRKRYLASPLSEFLGAAVIVIILWYGGGLILENKGSLSASGFITYIVVFSQILNPVKAFTNSFYNVQKGLASAERVDKILDADIHIRNKTEAKSIHEFNESIEYRDLSFAYEKDKVLNKINCIIPKGQAVAVVGQSGAGKSTFVDLLPRFFDATEGQILIDGIPLIDYKIEDLRSMMGIVSQESILFNDSFFNNIAFGSENAKMEDVIKAAKVANAHEFIMEYENNYHTNIGDRGGKLSGGQKQRISIARAVLKNPPILILDEATSSLDTESEFLVQEALNRLMKNRTSIIIAHRLSTIKNADNILVFDKGQVVESGKHTELIKKKGLYEKLHSMQVI